MCALTSDFGCRPMRDAQSEGGAGATLCRNFAHAVRVRGVPRMSVGPRLALTTITGSVELVHLMRWKRRVGRVATLGKRS